MSLLVIFNRLYVLLDPVIHLGLVFIEPLIYLSHALILALEEVVFHTAYSQFDCHLLMLMLIHFVTE